MSGRKELLAVQFAACADQVNWFVPLKQSVEGLTAEQAAWDATGTNSVWNNVQHLTFWNNRYLARYKGESVTDSVSNNSETFDVSAVDITEENWSNAVEALLSSLHNWRNTILDSTEDQLNTLVSIDHKELWWESIANIAIHNAYHIGQIIEIRKKQGSWKPYNWHI
ncbi:DinB family protein [Bacillus carboniphilus]|uniref:DinB family protein n=1 Tax=Bacillus carboniphilus TaxID=86663 RepID=A0ABN0VQP8_9BACI